MWSLKYLFTLSESMTIQTKICENIYLGIVCYTVIIRIIFRLGCIRYLTLQQCRNMYLTKYNFRNLHGKRLVCLQFRKLTLEETIPARCELLKRTLTLYTCTTSTHTTMTYMSFNTHTEMTPDDNTIVF